MNFRCCRLYDIIFREFMIDSLYLTICKTAISSILYNVYCNIIIICDIRSIAVNRD